MIFGMAQKNPLPLTGRLAIQLTSGKALCYPLYYFIASITRDAKYLIYHRAGDGEVQLHRLNLRTGESAQLTHGSTPHTRWKNWCVESGRGVLDHRSVLNVTRNQVIYFTGALGNDVHVVDVEALNDRLLFTLPDDREAVGQNCTTPDGRWFVYIHTPRGSIWGKPCRGAAVAAYNFDTGGQRTLCRIDSAVFHVTAFDDDHFIVTPPADHGGMLLTDLTSGRIAPLRYTDPGARGHLIHCQVTRRGIVYEVPEVQLSGLYDPLTRRRFEFQLPGHFQLLLEAFSIHTDTHGCQFVATLCYRIPHQNVAVQAVHRPAVLGHSLCHPIVVVCGPKFVRISVLERPANPIDKNGRVLLNDFCLALLTRQIRI